MRNLIAALFLCLVHAPAIQAQVQTMDYGKLAQIVDGRISFETLPLREEPGFNLNAPLRSGGAWIGERFAGQFVTGAPHDALLGSPVFPLRIKPGRNRQNLSVSRHREFGSNALFPLGPARFPALDARGEGAVAILFDRDQPAFGLLIHSDYPDPLGSRPSSGEVILHLYDRKGALITQVSQTLGSGVTPVALRRDGSIPDIAGVTITNTDPGGIAIDDILFQLTALTS